MLGVRRASCAGVDADADADADANTYVDADGSGLCVRACVRGVRDCRT